MRIRVKKINIIIMYRYSIGIFGFGVFLIFTEFLKRNTNEASPSHMVGFVIKMIICALLIWFSLKLVIQNNMERKRLDYAIQKYGEDAIIKQIENNTIAEYVNKRIIGNRTYFTEQYIYDNLESSPKVIAYEEIDQIYHNVVKHIFGSQKNIVIKSKAGWTDIICYNVSKEEYKEYLKICKEHQPNILVGNSKSIKDKHKQHVKEYKQTCH